MKIAVLAAPESWYFRDLARAAGNEHELVCLPFSQLQSDISSPGKLKIHSAGHDLTSFDAVLVRTMPPGSLEQVVFRMNALGRLENCGVMVLNPPRALEFAVDKYFTTGRLAEFGFPVPRTIVCQTVDDAMAAFRTLGGEVVVKPIFGGEGRGITRINDEALALRAFSMLVQLGAVLYLQEYIDHGGRDLRMFTLGEQVFGVRRTNDNDWRTNASRGAVTEAIKLNDTQVKAALKISQIAGAPLVAIDLVFNREGKPYILEVNAVPGWKALSVAHDLDMARLVLEYVEREVREQQRRNKEDEDAYGEDDYDEESP